jgi:hypothetical protein
MNLRYKKCNVVIDRNCKLLQCNYCNGILEYNYYYSKFITCSICGRPDKTLGFHNIKDMEMYLING